jgi:hypothetical protein
MQIPSPDTRDDWAGLRNQAIWQDPEFWEANKDYYAFWEQGTGFADRDMDHDDHHDDHEDMTE